MKKIILFSLLTISLLTGGGVLYFDKQDPSISRDQPKHHFPGRYFYPVELSSDEAEIPCLEVSIEGIPFVARLDSGFTGALSLPSEILNRLENKTRARPHVSYGIRGKQYRKKAYQLLSPLHLGNIFIKGIEATEINLDLERDLVISGDLDLGKKPPLATIGWKSFSKINLFLELSKPRMAFCDELDTLEEQGYLVDGAVTTEMLLDRGFIEFKVDTAAGPLRCLLDTGSTVNLRHKSADPFQEEPTFFHIDRKKELPPMDVSIEGHVVGPISFYEAELPCGIEAIVGIDFLNEHCIFLDFAHEKIYFLPPQPVQSDTNP